MICRFCGNQGKGIHFDKWVKPTFTDHDKLLPGEIVCNDCLFWFDEQSEKLAALVGKDKPQRMRNYSHFIVSSEWIPFSKGDKSRMKELLLSKPFPELAAIAESGQKHIVFRAIRNPVNSKAGWVQFEEQSLWLEPDELQQLLDMIEPALSTFSKTEIQSGQCSPRRILDYGLEAWQELEAVVKPLRSGLFFNLSIFLAQEREDTNAGNSRRSAGNHLARDRQRVQKSVSKDNMGAIREHNPGQRLHKQSGEVRQLGLPEIGRSDTGKAHSTSGGNSE